MLLSLDEVKSRLQDMDWLGHFPYRLPMGPLAYRFPFVTWTGPGRSGKDFAAAVFGRVMDRQLGLPDTTIQFSYPHVYYRHSMSYFALSFYLHEVLTDEEYQNLGKDPMDSLFKGRHNYRDWWRQFCDLMRAKDPLGLVSRCLNYNHHSLVGMRCKDELQAIRRLPLCGPVIWVKRNPEPPVDPTLEISEADCDFTVVNDGTKAFGRKIEGLASHFALAWKQYAEKS